MSHASDPHVACSMVADRLAHVGFRLFGFLPGQVYTCVLADVMGTRDSCVRMSQGPAVPLPRSPLPFVEAKHAQLLEHCFLLSSSPPVHCAGHPLVELATTVHTHSEANDQ